MVCVRINGWEIEEDEDIGIVIFVYILYSGGNFIRFFYFG